MGATSGAGTAYPSGALEFSSLFSGVGKLPGYHNSLKIQKG
jgi:hypothetical protein